MPNEFQGWYSSEQAEICGIIRYSKPDGEPVSVTQVTSGDQIPGAFQDMVCVGPVVSYLGRVRNGWLLPRMDMPYRYMPYDEPFYEYPTYYSHVAVNYERGLPIWERILQDDR